MFWGAYTSTALFPGHVMKFALMERVANNQSMSMLLQQDAHSSEGADTHLPLGVLDNLVTNALLFRMGRQIAMITA